MTAVEYLFETLWDCPKDKFTWYSILEKAKEMEKQMVIDAWEASIDNYGEYKIPDILSPEQYFAETYGSKGSDEILSSNNDKRFSEEDMRKAYYEGMADTETYSDLFNSFISSLTQSDSTSSQTQISDKEIEKEIKKRYETTQNDAGFRDGCAWYREQLKKKQ